MMFALSKLSNLAAAGSLAVVCLYCFPGRAEEPAQYTGPVGPHEAILTTVGHTRLIAFYEPDGTNCGLRVSGKPVFSVQHHPEASPGPQDSHYLFRRFVNLIREKKGEAALAER